MNHTIPIMKTQSQSYKNHLTPIAPAPLIAPKPAQLLPKPMNHVSRSSSSSSISTMKTSTSTINGVHNDSDTQSLPCIITSKQWVLPPRPKAGRKPTVDKKKLMSSASSTTSMQSLSNTMTGLNLQKSKSEIVKVNDYQDSDLKCQLETATEENQKLKNIISRLKAEIMSLQKPIMDYSDSSPAPQLLNSTPSSQVDRTSSSVTSVSTPINNTPSLAASRDVSPTVDPKYIGIGQSTPSSTNATNGKPVRQKRQYKKKPKKKDLISEELKIKPEDSPSPISLASIPMDQSASSTSGLPNIETIINSNNKVKQELDIEEYGKPTKKTKTAKLERSMSLQTQDLMLSPPPSHTHPLDRSLSTSIDPFEFNLHTHNLSRTTTMTTIDNEVWEIPASNNSGTISTEVKSECGFCGSSSACLCSFDKNKNLSRENDSMIGITTLEEDGDYNKSQHDFNYLKDNMKDYVINENDEYLNFFIKTEEDPQVGLMGL